MNLSEALQTWVEVTGVDPQQRRYTWGQMQIMQLHEALREALELDPSEITGRMLFDYVASTYFDDRSFSVTELLSEPERVAVYLQKSRALMGYLRGPEITEISAEFAARMLAAAKRYGAARKDVVEMIATNHQIALLRRDALRSMGNLQVHQFLDGEPSPDSVRPVYGKHVLRWWNVNSMLEAMTKAPPGISVNLIMNHANPLRSYFAFAIRNGGRIFMFTDKEATPHPLAEDLIHRPDKVFAARAERNWFPYDLAGLAYNEEGRAYVRQAESTALVAYQAATEPVKAIADLEAPVVLWLTMMLDLIVEKFWSQGYRAPKLSYTGEMLVHANRLLDAAGAANLPVLAGEQLALPPITLASIRTSEAELAEAAAADQDGEEGALGHRHGIEDNAWLEARFGAQANEECLSLVDRSDRPLALVFEPGAAAGQIRELTQRESEKPVFSHEIAAAKQRVQLDALDPTSFGTREELQANRLFLARSNYARQLDRLAREEFDARVAEVMAWVHECARANLNALLPMMLQERHLVPGCDGDTHRGGACSWHGKTSDGTWRRAIASCEPIREHHKKFMGEWNLQAGRLTLTGGGPWKDRAPTCYFTRGPSRFTAAFYPEVAEDLALMCGCTVADLPDVLQHWTLRGSRGRNHILNRVDPLAWQLANPWAELHFQVKLLISARAYAKLCKQHGIENPASVPRVAAAEV